MIFKTYAVLFSIFLSLSCLADKKRFANSDENFTKAEINRLRDIVVNTKTQVQMFQQMVDVEGITTKYPEIKFQFENRLSSRYRIFTIEYFVDGLRVYFYQSAIAKNKPNEKDEKPKDFVSSISPGKHKIKTVVTYIGNDSGVFSYLAEYKVRMSESQDIKVIRGTDVFVDVFTYEEGNILSSFREKAKLGLKVAGTRRGPASK